MAAIETARPLVLAQYLARPVRASVGVDWNNFVEVRKTTLPLALFWGKVEAVAAEVVVVALIANLEP